jgi:hypothetical protein
MSRPFPQIKRNCLREKQFKNSTKMPMFLCRLLYEGALMCIIVLFIYLGLFLFFCKLACSVISQNLDSGKDDPRNKENSIQYMHEKFLEIAKAKKDAAPKVDLNEVPKGRW